MEPQKINELFDESSPRQAGTPDDEHLSHEDEITVPYLVETLLGLVDPKPGVDQETYQEIRTELIGRSLRLEEEAMYLRGQVINMSSRLRDLRKLEGAEILKDETFERMDPHPAVQDLESFQASERSAMGGIM